MARAKIPRSIKYFRAIGIIGLLVGLGVSLTSSTLFWWSATFLYAGALFLILDVWFEPKLKNKRLLITAILMLLASYTVGIVLYPARLDIEAISFEGQYQSGESVFGIPWTDDFSELRVYISNPTERNFDHLDVDLNLEGGVVIRNQKQISDILGVSFIPT